MVASPPRSPKGRRAEGPKGAGREQRSPTATTASGHASVTVQRRDSSPWPPGFSLRASKPARRYNPSVRLCHALRPNRGWPERSAEQTFSKRHYFPRGQKLSLNASIHNLNLKKATIFFKKTTENSYIFIFKIYNFTKNFKTLSRNKKMVKF